MRSFIETKTWSFYEEMDDHMSILLVTRNNVEVIDLFPIQVKRSCSVVGSGVPWLAMCSRPSVCIGKNPHCKLFAIIYIICYELAKMPSSIKKQIPGTVKVLFL